MRETVREMVRGYSHDMHARGLKGVPNPDFSFKDFRLVSFESEAYGLKARTKYIHDLVDSRRLKGVAWFAATHMPLG